MTDFEYQEKMLFADPGAYAETYYNFISEKNDPSLMQACFERIVELLPLDDNWWLNYCSWCENDLKLPAVAYEVYKRATYNCPKNPWIWQGLLLAAERADEEPKIIDSFFNCSKEAMSDATSGLCLYRTFLYLLRRRAASTDKDYSKLNEVFAEGRSLLEEYFGHYWDYHGEYRRNYAYFLAANMKNMTEARKIWKDILASGGGSAADKWLEAINLERQFGEVQHARKLLYGALNSVADDPTKIYNYFIQFEREEGTLAELDAALKKVNAQQNHRSSRPQKQKKEKESKEKPERKRPAADSRGGPPAKITTPPAPQPKKENTPPTPVKDKDGFLIPFAIPSRKSLTPERSPKKEPQAEAATVEKSIKKEELAANDGKLTVFCSNLDYKATEEEIKKAFAGVIEVRLVMKKGTRQHKGFAYVDFDSEKHFREALNQDNQIKLHDRKMFISVNDPNKRHGFKYEKGREACKVFVKNVHFDCTEQQLKDCFSQFGEVVDVRIVTFKNGKAKGVAYVEFTNETDANKAVEATDITLHDRKVSVAISNPPARDGSTPTAAVPTPAAAEGARRSHIQIVPRSVTQKSSTNGTAGLSNAEFRKKFLGS